MFLDLAQKFIVEIGYWFGIAAALQRDDRLTSDQLSPIVDRSKAASATPRVAAHDRAYRGRRLERVAQVVAGPIAMPSRQSWSAHVPRPSTASKSRCGLHLMSGYWLPEEAGRAGDYR